MFINPDNGCRAQTLSTLRSPDESRDEMLLKFVQLASQALGIPGSFISVLDNEYQYVQVSHNFALDRSSRDDSLCRHAVDSDSAVVVPDTWLDARFVTHPLITGTPHIRFYAGVPLKNREGIVLGTLCVTDTAPHPFGDSQLTTLKGLAVLVMSFLEDWQPAGLTDPVTGLPNRQRLMHDLQIIATLGDHAPRRLVVIDCIDMPRAYDLIRAMGQGPVDDLILDISRQLPLRLRHEHGEMIYTIATGRFAVLTRMNSRLSAEWVAARLDDISAYLGEGLPVALTIHTGEVAFTPGALPGKEILRRAVSALHDAVSKGVASTRFSDATDARHTRDFTLMHELATAVREDNGLWIAYQPKISLHTGKPVGLEALIRWRHPLRGELSPDSFLPLAEQTGLLNELTAWVMDRTIARLTRLRNSSIQLPVAFNVSCHDFAREGFADVLEEKMINAGLPTALLGVECLENEQILANPAAISGLEMLKLRGFGIALDDFGTGYSNISYLRRMPLDVIKLDRSIICDIVVDKASYIVARSIISMLKELDYTVLAEGVEDAETATALADFGCDEAQGYYYARPMPETETDEWLADQLCGKG